MIGTPDWQHGTVSASALLASETGATTNVTVTVPTNAQTIMVVTNDIIASATTFCECIGVTTGALYPGTARFAGFRSAGYLIWLFAVASPLDAQVKIQWSAAPGISWYVVSTSGVSLVNVPTLDSVIQNTGAAIPVNALFVAGTDGTDLRGLLTDATGKLIISNPGGGAPAQTIGAATGSQGVLVLGSDGVDGRAIITDASGHLIPLVPNSTTDVVTVGTSATSLLAAPGSGHNYLFTCDIAETSASPATVTVTIGGHAVATVFCGVQGTTEIDFAGYVTNGAVTIESTVFGVKATLRYAPGP